MTITRITREWLITSALIQAIFSYSYTITSLYVMQHISTGQNALSGILFALFSAVAAHIALQTRVREFILKHGVLTICVASLGDAATELFLLIDPVIKLMGDVICGAFTMQVSQLLWMETKAVIYQNPNARVKFDLRLEKWRNFSLVIGCALVMIYETHVQTAMCVSIGGNLAYIGISCSRYFATSTYINENGLEYGVVEELA